MKKRRQPRRKHKTASSFDELPPGPFEELLADAIEKENLERAVKLPCIERGTLESSPCDRVKPPAPIVKRERVLSDSELALIWRATHRLDHPAGPFIRTLLLTGQRRNEVARMTWDEVSPDLTLWTLPASRSKNGREHVIPLAPAVRDFLTSMPHLNRFAFCTASGKVPLAYFSGPKHALDMTVTELNGGHALPPWCLHDLRRTFATTAARPGVQLPVIERVLNHTLGGVQATYQRHTFRDEMAAALARWSEHVVALSSPKAIGGEALAG